jgi:hypothetical protein
LPTAASGTIAEMRKVLTWLVVTLGIAALVRRLRRRPEPRQPAYAPPPDADAEPDPADELRRKLAESRVEDASANPAGESSVEERRAAVYEQSRSTLDEMQDTSEQ